MDLANQYQIQLIYRYIIIAATSLIYFDYSITIEEEVELVWKATNTFTKYGFLVYRYLAMAGATVIAYGASGSGSIDETFCRRGIPVLALLQTCSLAFADLIAVLHISAAWNRNWRVLVTLAAVYLVTTSIGLAGRISALPSFAGSINKFDATNSCVARDTDLRIAISWAAGAIFDLVALIFNTTSIFFRQRGTKTLFLECLRRHDIGYFIINFALRSTSLFLLLFLPPWMPVIVPALTWPITTITLSRLIFGTRKRRQRQEVEETNEAALSIDSLPPEVKLPVAIVIRKVEEVSIVDRS